ncbi:MAG: CHAD domain-containing protein [Lentisphaerales bacterium]|nr:MAG: CHAD domain-containing protein [Lentisphaerales bacterium]
MKQKLTCSELCRKYRNENVHTEYVTALARDIFERTGAHLGLSSDDFSSVVHETGTARETLRQLMLLQYRIIADARSEILKRHHPKDLHDLRVAIRRLRAALRLLRSRGTDRVAARLNNLLARFCKSLGPTRDAQVWELFLHLPTTGALAPRTAAWRAYLNLVHRRTARLTTTLTRTMQSDKWLELSMTTKRFLRGSMVRSSPIGNDALPFASLADRELKRLCTGLRGLEIDASELTPEELHSLRRKIRRARYWAEFLAPALPRSSVPTLAEIFRRCAGRLGDAHDMDVYIARLRRGRIAGTSRMEEGLLERRSRAVRKFQNTWDRRFRAELLDRITG